MSRKIDTIDEMYASIKRLAEKVKALEGVINELKKLNVSNKNIIRILREQAEK